MSVESKAATQLNAMFPHADASVVQDLAAMVALGRITLSQAAGNLRDMGYAEVAAPPSQPRPRVDGGEAPKAARNISGAPPAHVAAWVQHQDRYVPGSGVDVNNWRSGVGAPYSPDRSVPAARHPPSELPPDVSPVRDNDPYYGGASISGGAARQGEASSSRAGHSIGAGGGGGGGATTVHTSHLHHQGGSSAVVAPSAGGASSRARSATVGARGAGGGGSSHSGSPHVATKLDLSAFADAPPGHDRQVHLYITNITADRMVRDRVRGFERLLFLLAIPYESYDVSENKFLRRKLVDLCGGVDRGLPLLFVGDRVVGDYDSVQELVDFDGLVPLLMQLGADLPRRVIDDHFQRKATVPSKTTSAPISATVVAADEGGESPTGRRGAAGSVSVMSPLIMDAGNSSGNFHSIDGGVQLSGSAAAGSPLSAKRPVLGTTRPPRNGPIYSPPVFESYVRPAAAAPPVGVAAGDADYAARLARWHQRL